MSKPIDNNTINHFFIDQFFEFERQLNGQKNLPIHANRKKAIEQFEELGVPGVKNEDYKYTNIGKVLEQKFDLHSFKHSSSELTSEDFSHFLIDGMDTDKIVFINGIYSEEFSVIQDQDGLEVMQLEKAFGLYPDEIQMHFDKNVETNKDGFAALNTAFVTNGVYIRAAKNKVVEKPISLYYIKDTKQSETFTFPRNLIISDHGSQLKIVEIYGTVGSQNSFTNAMTEIVVGENSNCDYYKIGNDSENAYHIGLTKVYQENYSTFNSTSIAFGGGIMRNNIRIVIDGEGCTANMNGLFLLDGKSHVDNHTEVDHRKPHSNSNELYKGILDGKSTGVFNGKIFVRQEAQKTNAFQSNKNILLTDTATINTKPQLEIWADDVKCSHGCTTGQLDDDALFYLRARGIDKESARAMLLYAFAVDVLNSIQIVPLKKHLDRIIADRFNQEILD
jgi:Fe-S cluster assembly protein SufD